MVLSVRLAGRLRVDRHLHHRFGTGRHAEPAANLRRHCHRLRRHRPGADDQRSGGPQIRHSLHGAGAVCLRLYRHAHPGTRAFRSRHRLVRLSKLDRCRRAEPRIGNPVRLFEHVGVLHRLPVPADRPVRPGLSRHQVAGKHRLDLHHRLSDLHVLQRHQQIWRRNQHQPHQCRGHLGCAVLGRDHAVSGHLLDHDAERLGLFARTAQGCRSAAAGGDLRELHPAGDAVHGPDRADGVRCHRRGRPDQGVFQRRRQQASADRDAAVHRLCAGHDEYPEQRCPAGLCADGCVQDQLQDFGGDRRPAGLRHLPVGAGQGRIRSRAEPVHPHLFGLPWPDLRHSGGGLLRAAQTGTRSRQAL